MPTFPWPVLMQWPRLQEITVMSLRSLHSLLLTSSPEMLHFGEGGVQRPPHLAQPCWGLQVWAVKLLLESLGFIHLGYIGWFLWNKRKQVVKQPLFSVGFWLFAVALWEIRIVASGLCRKAGRARCIHLVRGGGEGGHSVPGWSVDARSFASALHSWWWPLCTLC